MFNNADCIKVEGGYTVETSNFWETDTMHYDEDGVFKGRTLDNPFYGSPDDPHGGEYLFFEAVIVDGFACLGSGKLVEPLTQEQRNGAREDN